MNKNALVIIDVQNCFINKITRNLPIREVLIFLKLKILKNLSFSCSGKKMNDCAINIIERNLEK